MSDHRIHLDAFDGPLDLLLHLIRKAEVEITDIPIAEIADQYMRHLTESAHVDIDAAGEFLLMAATLMEIKSRVLTRAAEPKTEESTDGKSSGGDGGDPRAELVRQLLAYKQHRDAADALAARRTLWERRFTSARAAHDREALLEATRERTSLDLSDLTIGDLAASYATALQRVDLDRLGEHHVSIEHDDTPIELHQADILHRVAESEGLSLRDLFAGRRRSEIVGLFIALLELVRERRLTVATAPDAEDVSLAPAPMDASETGEHETTPAAERGGR
jgi:segregation and condensation protein A